MDHSGKFSDLVDGDDAYWGVRSHSTGIGVTLGRRSDVDIEVFMDKETARAIEHALLDAAGTSN